MIITTQTTWTEIGVSKAKTKERLKEKENRWALMAVVH